MATSPKDDAIALLQKNGLDAAVWATRKEVPPGYRRLEEYEIMLTDEEDLVWWVDHWEQVHGCSGYMVRQNYFAVRWIPQEENNDEERNDGF